MQLVRFPNLMADAAVNPVSKVKPSLRHHKEPSLVC